MQGGKRTLGVVDNSRKDDRAHPWSNEGIGTTALEKPGPESAASAFGFRRTSHEKR